MSRNPVRSQQHVMMSDKPRIDSNEGFGAGAGPVTAGGFNTAGKAPIEIRGFSLAKAFLYVGVSITVISFADFFLSGENGAGVSSLGFIYGLPITLIGCSLQYAELEPAGLQTNEKAEALFEAKATETMKEVLKDVTRHRYGDEAHLDTTVKSLGLVLPQKAYPQLQYVMQEPAEGGEVAMTMVFQSLDTPYRMWAERTAKYDNFFGPDLWSEVIKVDAEEKLVGVKLTTGAKPASAEVVPEEAPAPAAA